MCEAYAAVIIGIDFIAVSGIHWTGDKLGECIEDRLEVRRVKESCFSMPFLSCGNSKR